MMPHCGKLSKFFLIIRNKWFLFGGEMLFCLDLSLFGHHDCLIVGHAYFYFGSSLLIREASMAVG